MSILVFGASNHSQSINAALAQYAGQRFVSSHMPGAAIELLNLNDYEMPIYSLDREKSDGIHDLAKDFFAKIGSADALIISYPEYNGSYTSAWKNIYDWMSRIDQKVYQDKPTVALAATPGPRSGASILQAVEMTAPFFGMDLCGALGVGRWNEAYDKEKRMLTDGAMVADLDKLLAALAEKVG